MRIMEKSDLEIKCKAQSETIVNLQITVAEQEGRISDLEIKLVEQIKIKMLSDNIQTQMQNDFIRIKLQDICPEHFMLECIRRGITKDDFL